MKKNRKSLQLSRETLRSLVAEDLHEVNGGGHSCGGATACDCSGPGPTGTNQGSMYCTLMQR